MEASLLAKPMAMGGVLQQRNAGSAPSPLLTNPLETAEHT